MGSYRTCPFCRAALTDPGGSPGEPEFCPECGARVPPPEVARVIAEEFDGDFGPAYEIGAVPQGVSGKVGMAVRLLLDNLPLLAALVLTVWLPGNILVEHVARNNPDPNDPMPALRASSMIEGLLGPIYAGAVIATLSGIMTGQRPGYGEALRLGLRNWGRLFAARFLAGLILLMGFLALIVPGLVLYVRFSLVDAVVVLEEAGPIQALRRSNALVRGRFWPIAGALVVVALVPLAGLAVQLILLELVPATGSRVGLVAMDCLVDVLFLLGNIVAFLYYWEAREQEAAGEAQLGEITAKKPAVPDDGLL